MLTEFAAHGAPEEILYNAKPHIGTDKLRDTVKNIREELISLGAEIFFDTKLTDIKTNDGRITAAEVEHKGAKRLIECNEIVLAIGHSARDTFELLHQMGIHMTPKPFSVGVRIEHLRENIDRSQYGAAHDASCPPPTISKASTSRMDAAYIPFVCAPAAWSSRHKVRKTALSPTA